MEKFKFPLSIQYFAEEEDTEKPEGEVKGEEETPTLDDLLETNPEYAAELQRRTEAKLEEQRKEWEKEASEKRSRAEELAKLNEDERRQAELEDKERELERREREIEMIGLKTEARGMFSEKNLPGELAEFIDYSSADSIKTSVTAIGQIVEDVVSERVKKIAKGGTVPGSGAPGREEDSRKSRNKKWEERLGL